VVAAGAPQVAADTEHGKGARTRRRLLDIAVRRFADQGYRRTSVSEIAREAALTPAAAYAYFEGKEALFEAAVDADASALIDEARADAGEGTIRERWPRFLASLVTRVDAHPLARRVLGGHEPEVIHRLLDLPSLARVRADMAADLTVAAARGEIREDLDPDAFSVGLETIALALLMGHVQTGAAGDDVRADGVFTVIEAALGREAR
jgi:AcrR family transcriptional regulator